MTIRYIQNPVTLAICDCCKTILKFPGTIDATAAVSQELARRGWRVDAGLFDGCEQHRCENCVAQMQAARRARGKKQQ